MFERIRVLFKNKEVKTTQPIFRMEATVLEHPEDSKVSYIELRDNLRLIVEDNKCVGFYIA